jgi:hypothetical protein
MILNLAFLFCANGYADIIEIKLPNIKYISIVGKNNREYFNSELNTYMTQTRVYATFLMILIIEDGLKVDMF